MKEPGVTWSLTSLYTRMTAPGILAPPLPLPPTPTTAPDAPADVGTRTPPPLPGVPPSTPLPLATGLGLAPGKETWAQCPLQD